MAKDQIEGIAVFFDDVRITAPDDKLHLARLQQVLERFYKYNVRVNFDKCTFLADQIDYCGYIITKCGIQKSHKKIETIQTFHSHQIKMTYEYFWDQLIIMDNFLKILVL